MNEITKECDARKEKGSFVNMTNDGEACPRHRVATLVQMNCEQTYRSNQN